MGDFADDTFDNVIKEEIDFDNIVKEYKNLSDNELKNRLEDIIHDDWYSEDKYTDMVKSILKYDDFTEKQRNVLVLHAAYHHYDYEDEINTDEYIHEDFGNRD